MVAYTTTYNLKKPTVADDEDVWGGYLNDSMDLIDDVLDGTTPVTGIDINSGTIGGVTIDGNLSFGDNTQAIFGADSDFIIQWNETGSTFNIVSNTSKNVNITTGGIASIGSSGAQAQFNGAVTTISGNTSISLSGATISTTTGTGGVTLDYNGSDKIATSSTGVSVTGNITVSGTVDGRDVAADGTKLDGIESGATADQTKADIDALGIAASTAATLATARNIALSGDVSGSASFNGSANISITATVADDSHNHVISNIDGLQSALDGKQASGTYNTIIGTDSDINTSGSTIIDNIYVTDGVITSMGTRTLTTGDIGAYSSSGGTISGNVTINGTLSLGAYTINDVEDIYLRDKLFHDGDTDTYLGFGTNVINLYTGGTYSQFTASGLFISNGSLAEDYDALSGTTPTCNVDNGGAFSLTMSGNTTFTFSGPSSGYSQGFILQLTGNGSTVTWPSSVDWAGGTAPDAPASGETDIYVFWTRDGGTTWYGVQSIDAAA